VGGTEVVFLVQTCRWIELLQMLEVTTTGSQALTQRQHSAFSSCRLLKSFPYWAQCQIREHSTKRTVYLVCM